MTARRAVLVIAVVVGGCARPVRPAPALPRVADSVAVIAADSAIANSADALYGAGLKYGTPGQPSYDPERGVAALQQFVALYPRDRRSPAAQERLALLEEIRALRQELEALKAIDLRRHP